MESNPYRVNMLTVSTKAAQKAAPKPAPPKAAPKAAPPKAAPKAAPKVAPKPTPSYNGLDKDINKLVMQPMSIELFRCFMRLQQIEVLQHVLTLELRQCRQPDAASYMNLESQTSESMVMHYWLKAHRDDLIFDKQEYETLKQNDQAKAQQYATNLCNKIESVLRGLCDRHKVLLEVYREKYYDTMCQAHGKTVSRHGPSSDKDLQEKLNEQLAYAKQVLHQIEQSEAAETEAEVESSLDPLADIVEILSRIYRVKPSPAAKPRDAAQSGARRRS